jgi:hypothetical protein
VPDTFFVNLSFQVAKAALRCGALSSALIYLELAGMGGGAGDDQAALLMGEMSETQDLLLKVCDDYEGPWLMVLPRLWVQSLHMQDQGDLMCIISDHRQCPAASGWSPLIHVRSPFTHTRAGRMCLTGGLYRRVSLFWHLNNLVLYTLVVREQRISTVTWRWQVMTRVAEPDGVHGVQATTELGARSLAYAFEGDWGHSLEAADCLEQSRAGSGGGQVAQALQRLNLQVLSFAANDKHPMTWCCIQHLCTMNGDRQYGGAARVCATGSFLGGDCK